MNICVAIRLILSRRIFWATLLVTLSLTPNKIIADDISDDSKRSSEICGKIESVRRDDSKVDRYTVSGVSKCSGVGRLQLAVRRTGGQVWWVLPTNLVPLQAVTWQISTALGLGRLGRSESFELVILSADSSSPPICGWLLDGKQTKASEPFQFRTSTISNTNQKPPKNDTKTITQARVSISRVGGKTVDIDYSNWLSVSLKESVHGRVHKEDDDSVQCVVQPLVSDSWWVMHGGHSQNGHFDCAAHFGEGENFSEFEEFLLYAVITNPRLPPGKSGFNSEDWRQFTSSGRIMAVSPTVRVIRSRRLLKGQNEASVTIQSIDERSIPDTGRTIAPPVCSISGDTGGPGLLSQKVSVYSLSKTNGTSKLVGHAQSSDGRRWSVVQAKLGEKNEEVDLVAVRYNGQPPDLSSPSASYIAKSEPITVMVIQPEVEIRAIECRMSQCSVHGFLYTNASELISIHSRIIGTDQWRLLAGPFQATGGWQAAIELAPNGIHEIVALVGEKNPQPHPDGIRRSLPMQKEVK